MRSIREATQPVPEELFDAVEGLCDELTWEQKRQIALLLVEFIDIIARKGHPLGRTSRVEHEIRIVPGNPPIKQRP